MHNQPIPIPLLYKSATVPLAKRQQFKFVYDLSEEWKKFTGLPFVFAAWIANKPIRAGVYRTSSIHRSKFGLDHRAELLKALPKRADFDLEDYLMHKLDFNLTENKKKALFLFLDYIKAL